MTEFERSLAIVIGINNYQNGISALKSAVPDAMMIANILQNTYEYKLIHPDFDSGIIVNRYATKDRLETLLKDILPHKIKPTKSDRLLFYFAGHGIARNNDEGPEGYLVPQDADLKKQDSLLRMSDVHDWLAHLECRHLFVVLDCCFAGTFRWASYRKLIPITEITKAHYDHFIQFPAWQVLTSASHNQEALDFLNNRDVASNKKHSPFAEGLIKALQQEKGDLNNDGVIMATELYLYLRDYVELNSQDRQTPGLFPLKKHERGEYIFKLPHTPLNLKETPKLNQENNPYRGLEPFEERHAALFFGREKVVKNLFAQVSQPNNQLTVVTGISGSGKSSLVKAGLIPYLRQNQQRQWLIFAPIRPGFNPYAAITRILSQLDSNLSKRTGDTTLLGKQLQNNSSKFIGALQAWSQQNPNSRMFLVIDQFEELITMAGQEESASQKVNKSWWQKLRKKLGLVNLASEPDKLEEESEQWKKFIALLADILGKCPQFSLVITLRSDFEPRFQESAFCSDWAKARFLVRPMRSDELREAVEKPASEKALYFEPPELVEHLIDEVSQMPGALPLLSFTLSEMYIKLYKAWRERGNEDRALTVAEDFELQGGVAGTLTRRANEIQEKLPDRAHQLMMRRVMLRMVKLEGEEAVRRRVLAPELVYPDSENNERKDEVLARLLEARLIVTGTDGETDEQYYEPAHDYLVRGWDKLQLWIQKEQQQGNLVLQSFVTPAAFDWEQEGKSKQFLWNANPRLDLLKQVLNSNDNWLNAIETNFVQSSLKRRSFNTRRNWTLAIAVILGLSSGLVFSLIGQRNTLINQARAYQQSAQANLSLNQSLDGMVDSLQAGKALQHPLVQNHLLQLFGSTKKLEELQDKIEDTLQWAVHRVKETNRMTGDSSMIIRSIVSPNHHIIASAGEDGSIKLWDLQGKVLKNMERG